MSPTKVIVTFYWAIAIFLGHWKLQYMIHFNSQSISQDRYLSFRLRQLMLRVVRYMYTVGWPIPAIKWQRLEACSGPSGSFTELLLIMGYSDFLELTWKSRTNTTYWRNFLVTGMGYWCFHWRRGSFFFFNLLFCMKYNRLTMSW